MIKIDDQKIIDALYRVYVYKEAVSRTKPVTDIEEVKKRIMQIDQYQYEAWSLIAQRYPEIKEDMERGISWGWQRNAVGYIFLFKQMPTMQQN
jgi:hypothetical protein